MADHPARLNPNFLAPPPAPEAARRYLDILKRCITRDLFVDEEVVDVVFWQEGRMFATPEEMYEELAINGFRLVKHNHEVENRREGRYYPPHAESMVGDARLDNVEELCTRALLEEIPGDFVETGVWRGGAVILMRAILAAYGDTSRTVWACDSFQGLPEPDPDNYPADVKMKEADSEGVSDTMMSWLMGVLAVSRDKVEANVARYGLLDDQVRFLEGWFRDTLPDAPIDTIAVLRLDGDLYESTMDGLVHLESKVSPGGFVIVDDYSSIDACRQAVTDYRTRNGITAEIHEIDWTGVWWQKDRHGA